MIKMHLSIPWQLRFVMDDNNCNGSIDEELLIVAYTDNDQDGFGDIESPQYVCQDDDFCRRQYGLR